MCFKYPTLPYSGIALWRGPGLPIFTSAILFLLFLAACNVSGNRDHSKGTDSLNTQGGKADSLNAASHPGNAAAPGITGEPLFTYYRDATTIFNLIRKDRHGNARGKIVFQYLVNNTGALTLSAFAGERGSQGFDATRMVVMNNSATVVAYIPNLMFLSDQEMSINNHKNHDDITPLLAEIKKHPGPTTGEYEGYIAFRPSLIDFDVPSYKTIQYEVGWSATTDKIDKHAFTAIPGATVNPSPPRNSY